MRGKVNSGGNLLLLLTQLLTSF